MASEMRDLNAALWAAADEMRKVMSADVYKDYLLGLVFYKALSDKTLVEAYELVNDTKPESLDVAQAAYEAAQDSDDWQDLQSELRARLGCAIRPRQTFTAFYRRINDRIFMLDELSQAFRDVENAGGGVYEGLFDDFDIQSKDLGKTPDKRNEMISSVIRALADIDFSQ